MFSAFFGCLVGRACDTQPDGRESGSCRRSPEFRPLQVPVNMLWPMITEPKPG